MSLKAGDPILYAHKGHVYAATAWRHAGYHVAGRTGLPLIALTDANEGIVWVHDDADDDSPTADAFRTTVALAGRLG